MHYAYPAHFPADLFRVMRERDNVCKYMDIALQHISDNMLQKMRRHVTKDETYKLIEQFREEVPGIHSTPGISEIRSTSSGNICFLYKSTP